MIKLSQGKFEKLEHTVYGGDSMNVPLYIGREFGLTEESKALLHASNIIGSSLAAQREEDPSVDLETIFERLASRLSDEEDAGVILEDPHGKGSLNVGPKTTAVRVREVGQWVLPTTLVFDMGQAWADLSDKDF